MPKSSRPSTRSLLAVVTATLTFAAVAMVVPAVGVTPAPTVTGLSPTSGGAGTDISIAGTGFTSTSTVLVGTVAATNVVEQSTTMLQATIPSGPRGTVDVTVATPGAGTSATSSADRFTYIAAPKALTWTKQYNADLNSGDVLGVSCPARHRCLAGDSFGNSITYRQQWKAPVHAVSGDLKGIDCTSPTHCLAIDEGGVTVFNGHGWSKPNYTIDRDGLSALSCASSTACFSVSGGDAWYRYNGHTWSTIRKANGSALTSLYSLSCPSATFCMEVGPGGKFQTLRDGKLSAVHKVGSTLLTSVSCVSSHACVALVERNRRTHALLARRFDGSHWHSVVDLGVSGDNIGQVSCPTSSFCAIGAGHYGITTAGPSLRRIHHTSIAASALGVLSCASAQACETFDVTGKAYRWDGHHWSVGHVTDPVRGGIQDVTCWTVSDCMAVDVHGYAIRRKASGWKPTRIDHNLYPYLTGVGCAHDGTCAATDYAGYLFVYEHSHWTSGTRVFRDAYDADDVSCASSTQCVVVGRDGTAAEWNGSRWSTATAIGNGTKIDSVSCASDGSCAAIQHDASGNSYFLNRTGPGQWSSRELTIPNAGEEAAEVDCLSATSCVVDVEPPDGSTGDIGILYLTGTLWSPEEHFSTFGTDQNAGGLTCASTRFCGVQDASETAEDVDVFDATGNATSFPKLIVNEDVHLVGLSCPAVNNCLATNDEGVSRGT